MLQYIYDKFNCILCYVGYENIIKIKSGDITHVVAMNVIRNGYVWGHDVVGNVRDIAP